jgi:hypothetical protein
VRRREFITLVGGAAAGWPLAARAQQTKVARIGFLGSVSASSHAPRLAAFRAGLRDLGWLEGTNLFIEYRWAEGNYERLRGLADELIQLKVDILVTHATPAALATKAQRPLYLSSSLRLATYSRSGWYQASGCPEEISPGCHFLFRSLRQSASNY